MVSKEDLNALKMHQYCDNISCTCYHKVGVGNIKTHSRTKGQIYVVYLKLSILLPLLKSPQLLLWAFLYAFLLSYNHKS